jgi:hypothetical protein
LNTAVPVVVVAIMPGGGDEVWDVVSGALGWGRSVSEGRQTCVIIMRHHPPGQQPAMIHPLLVIHMLARSFVD